VVWPPLHCNLQTNQQAIAGRIPSMSDRLKQIYDHACDRWSLLILADPNSANFLAREIWRLTIPDRGVFNSPAFADRHLGDQ